MTQDRDDVLRLEGITKRFGGLVANDAISLHLKRGEVLALLGENGAGKTTLMNILFGQYTADAGTVEVFGKRLQPGKARAALDAGVGMVHQHFSLAANLTVLDNILLGTERLTALFSRQSEARQKITDLVERFHLAVDLNARVSDLSVGERQRVEILKALFRDVRILILDEPTAVLTPQEASALFKTLREAVQQGLSIIFISHKLNEVMSLADRVVVLRHGRVLAERVIGDEDKAGLAALMVGDNKQISHVAPGVAGPPLLRLENVSLAPDANKQGLRHISMSLHAGQITGLAGVSGNGQGVLADLIAGLHMPAQGDMLVEGRQVAAWTPRAALAAGVARIPEDRHATGSIADFDLTENVILETYRAAPYSRSGWLSWSQARKNAQDVISQYDVRCPGPDTAIRLLSGGNMQKFIVGRALKTGPCIILANQPVRGLDIGAVSAVHARLIAARDAGAAVFLVSEDLDEINMLSDVVHVISEGRLSPGFARGSLGVQELGLWMAGQGFEELQDAS
ncbi:MAG: ABC transporter ATP-binding protein [Roseobacter sp.]